MAASKPLVITAGEPAGIGPEICNALADTPWSDRVVVIGDARLLDERLEVIDMPFPVAVAPGDAPAPANAATLLDGLRTAATGCMDGRFAGMVTAPLAKSVVAESGVPFSGHTEFLAELGGAATPVMMLVAADLRVALASTHLPLREVAHYITAPRLEKVRAS